MEAYNKFIILIHSWYPSECCSEVDCKPIRCDELIEGPNGTFLYQGLTFLKEKVFTSLDAQCHVCIRELGDTLIPLCAFIQVST